jgi:flagellar hook-length control protein FliK
VEVSITQLFCPAEQSGSVSGQAEASAACASPDCQQEMSAGSKTLIADMPQTEAARREKSAVQGKADTLPAGKEQDGISKAECPICEATAPHSGKEQQNIRPVQRQESVLASQSAFEQLAEPPLTNERAPTPKSRVNIDAQSDGEGRAVQAEQEGTKTDLPPAPLDVKGAPTGPIAEDMRINTANNKIAFKSDIAPERTLDNLTDQIVDKADLFLGKDHADLKLKLNPEFLGQLKLNIRVVKGIVQAHFIAENLATAGLIEGRLYDLRHSLEQQGISWQQLSVSVDGQQGQQVSQNFAGAGESYGGYRQMSGSESSVCAAEEQQNERAVQWQPGSVNYLI